MRKRVKVLDMKLSKVNAAKLIGVSRQTLYAYINSGRISADPEGTIDTAELLRAGFTLRQGEYQNDVEPGRDLTFSHVQVDTYREIIELLRQQLVEAQERERAAREREALLLHMLRDAQQQSQRLLALPKQAQATVSVLRRTPSTVPEAWERILAFMRRSNRPLRPVEVQEALGLATEARYSMKRMVKRGLLRRVEHGLYEPS
jgi:DNA-binding XRE family transcriptional regulator